MKPDYKNWIPKGMLVSLIAGTVLSLALLLVFGVFGVCVSGKLRVVLGVVFGVAFVVCAKYTQWCVYAYRSFSYDGERKLSKQIIDGTAEHITGERMRHWLWRFRRHCSARSVPMPSVGRRPSAVCC